jgi:hypothetical protein
MERSQPDAEFLQQRLEAISRGLMEGIRREVARRRKLGLPIYVPAFPRFSTPGFSRVPARAVRIDPDSPRRVAPRRCPIGHV